MTIEADPATVRTVTFATDTGDLHYAVEGCTTVGAAHVMLDGDDDLSSGTPWADAGYVVVPFLDAPRRARLRRGLTEVVAATLAHCGSRPPVGFTLERYHELVDDDRHQAVIDELFREGIAVDRLPVPIGDIEADAARVCGVSLTAGCPARSVPAVCLRIVRPGSTSDHNPPHRDVWLDRLRHAVNGYVPLAGSTERSGLALVPGSHRWPESDIERTVHGARIGGKSYDVPAVTATRHELRLVRPDPGPDEALLFSPYLIHGAGNNLEPDTTRVSLELRFWRA